MKRIKKLWRKYFVGRHVVNASYKQSIMTITWDDGTIDKYEGSCTVWHKHPFMDRCSTSKEYLLCDIWHYIRKWGGDYPNAHTEN